MKIYVAGKWGNSDEMRAINAIQALLVAHGHTITHDWTRVEGDKVTADTMVSDARREFRARCATLDVDGVVAADALVVLMTDCTYPYRGTFTEIGVALGLKKRILLIAPRELRIGEGVKPPALFAATNCFFEHPSIEHVDTVEDVICALNE